MRTQEATPILANFVARFRFFLAWDVARLRFYALRYLRRAPLRRYAEPDAAGVNYSLAWLARYGPDARIYWPLFLLASIPDVRRDSLLVVGPRYETELLLARALGFDNDGIRGLDTFSYSPLVDVGDMHELPYGDARFANVLCPWTLSYSKRPDVAADELARVLEPGGYLIVSVERVPSDYVDTGEIDGILTGEDRVQTPEQFDRLFPGLERVAGFTPSDPMTYGQTMVAYRKPSE